MQHELKILPEFFTAIIFGKKKFEIRKNDRDFRVGDVLKLMEYDGKNYTGNFIKLLTAENLGALAPRMKAALAA